MHFYLPSILDTLADTVPVVLNSYSLGNLFSVLITTWRSLLITFATLISLETSQQRDLRCTLQPVW